MAQLAPRFVVEKRPIGGRAPSDGMTRVETKSHRSSRRPTSIDSLASKRVSGSGFFFPHSSNLFFLILMKTAHGSLALCVYHRREIFSQLFVFSCLSGATYLHFVRLRTRLKTAFSRCVESIGEIRYFVRVKCRAETIRLDARHLVRAE